MIMDDGSETSNQRLLAGIMLPPPFALSFATLSSLRWLLRLRIKNNTSSASSSKLLEKPNETTVADCHCIRASGQDFTRIWNPRRLRLTITIITTTTCMQIFSSSSYYWLEKFNKEQDPGTLIDEDCEDVVCFFSSSFSWPWKS
jgi:hypothetical protein